MKILKDIQLFFKEGILRMNRYIKILRQFITPQKYYFTLIIFPLILFLSYQNCSQQFVMLYQISSDPSFFLKYPLKVNLCSEISFLKDDNNNFLFIIDMSRSNIGRFGEKPGEIGSFWFTDTAKDIDGHRFNAIETFINTCANSDNNKFAVIGFSSGAGQVEYNNTGNDRRAFLNCGKPIPFESKEEAIEDLELFREAQELEKNYFSSRWSNSYYKAHENNSPSQELAWTSYSQASDCASKVIRTDFIETYETQISNYQIIFLSDGRPSDPPPQETCNEENPEQSESGCSENCKTYPEGEKRDDCYIKNSTNPIKQTMLDLSGHRSKVNMLTVSYGIEKEEDFKFLNALSSINKEEGEVPVKRLKNFNESNVNILCKLVSTDIGYEVNSDSLMSVVLSLGQRNGVYLSDSDMDGLFDIDEPFLSYNPQNPRSGVEGVLDGICEKIGGLSKCVQAMYLLKENGGGCDPTQMLNSGGLSDCDIKLIKQHWSHLNLDDSSDWDKDGVPNFIEIVKTTDPFSNDMIKDIDNDGLNTQFEIGRSKNPFEHNESFPTNLNEVLVHNTFKSLTNECPYGSQDLILERVPPIETQSIASNEIVIHKDLVHDENEHIVAIFSSRTTRGYLLLDKGMFGKFVKLHDIKLEDSNTYKDNETNQDNKDNEDTLWSLSPSLEDSQLTLCDLSLWDPVGSNSENPLPSICQPSEDPTQ